jgi:phosphatidate cytidylyltransferase
MIDTLYLAIILGLIVCLGAWEWTKFAALCNTPYGTLYVVFIGLSLAGCYLLLNTVWSHFIIYTGAFWWLVAIGLIIAIEGQKIPLIQSPLIKLCIGFLVLIPAWLSLISLHGSISGNGPMHLIFLFLLIWTADIAAFFTGKKWGKNHLAALISPAKTWEGAYGAILASGLLAYLYGITLKLQLYDIIIFLILSVLTVIVSITGDLMESLMKRSVNIKDSGNILPGHGGVLDRIDSLSAAAPFFLATTLMAGILL